MKTEYLLLLDDVWYIYPGITMNSFELRQDSTHWNSCKTKQEAESRRAALPKSIQAATKIIIRKSSQAEVG